MPVDSEAVELVERRVQDELRSIQDQYEAALGGDDEEGTSFRALDTPLRVDQVRHIVAPAFNPEDWIRRGDKFCLTTASDYARDALSRYVGTDRFLPADVFADIVLDIARGRPVRASELGTARFANLAIVEPSHVPENRLPIWVAVATTMAAEKG